MPAGPHWRYRWAPPVGGGPGHVEAFGGPSHRPPLLDDQAKRSIQSIQWWEAPYTGSFAPVNPLGLFNGEDPNGTWTLNVRNPFWWSYFYSGSVNAFTLIATTAPPNRCCSPSSPG